ncbi:hypothetical protein [Methanospirillum hungatei]|uniref:hypothetical protein n=1 Tax=Methanospirillum hungatei TaxID=2203 RepID=UPI0026EFA5D5|nr:hypothetical protein [Methanospirillum hungatei]MCA1917303.1 hypothetical protein [Methanospirillum hungatei]
MNPGQISGCLILCLCLIYLISVPVLADDGNSSNQTNLTSGNETPMIEGIEYPEDGFRAAEGLDYGISAQGYADVGRVSTGFSGSSLEARGTNQSPSVVMSFSDKSSVSGFIKNFMKSFHYESGTDL